MMKWISAAVLAAAVSGVTAKSNIAAMNPTAHQELVRSAIKAASGVPQLRKAEARRLKAFSSKMRSLAEPKDRVLQNNYNNYQQGQYNYNGNQQQGQNNYNEGQYYDADYDGDYQWNEEMNEEAFGFDISAYSIKYTGCHTVETYNENLAGNEQFETMLGNQNYATFRLCPTETCNANNKWGCDSNYGEYVVPLYEYVESIVGYGEARVEAFCGFCEDCAAKEAYRAFANNQRNQMEYDMQIAEQVYETFKENYAAQEAYNANANGGGGYYEDYAEDEEDEDEDATYLVAFYQSISNMQQYNNQNGGSYYNSYNGNQQQSNPATSYNFYNQNMWQFSQNGNQGQQQQQQNSNQQDTWSNMGQFASYGTHTLYPGYFSNQGEFVQGWGYFLDGAFVSIEDGEVAWDENTYGEMPAAWADYIGVDPDEIEACDYTYSSNCYNNYQQCMLYLAADEDEDENAWMQNAVYADDQMMAQMESYMAYIQSQQQQQQYEMAAMTGEIYACRQVYYEPQNQNQDAQGQYNQYQNQQYNNAQYYQLNKYMNAQLESCGDDEACIYDIETQMQQNQDFMDWLEEYNENNYDQYVNGEKLYYIGATCADDGDIGLSVYNDEDCSYIDDSLSVAKVLGFDPDDILNYDLIPSDCISCDNQDFMNDQFYYGEDEEDNEDYYEGVTPMCSMLYQIAGKCNENLSPTNVYGGYYEDGVYVENSYASMYQSYQQQENQDLVCSFVESLNSGTYDQSGQVYLDNSAWGTAGKWQEGIANASRNMPGGLKAALFLTALAAALMGVWACMLHGALARKNIPWQPKRGDGADAVDIARQNSGIVMGRSRSGPVTHPLI